jgi:hypothetical protein
MHEVIRKGTTSKLLLAYARQAQNSEGALGLHASMTSARGAYVRAGALRAVEFPLLPGRIGSYTEGGFTEVDGELVPGVYQIGIPDAALADGADQATVVLRFPGTVVEPIHISLVAYDPQDGNRMGMSAIGPEERIAALRGAFPLLTAQELQTFLREKPN